MKQPFFITGMPRSRTAWMANFFTTQNSFCLHDAMKDGWTARHIGASLLGLEIDGYDYRGDADSGLLLHTTDLVEMFPAARWLFIRNTPERAAASYRNYFKPGNEYPGVSSAVDVERMMDNIGDLYVAALASVPEAQRVEVTLRDLDQPGIMRECWDWLVPGLAWDERRYRMLDTLRVNVMPNKITVAPVPNGGPF